MSILIKGMEMPTRCSECLLAKLSPTGESLICNYMLSRVPWDERPFDCPLVLVPPHGRLIDADTIGLTNFEIILCKQEQEPYKEALKMILDKIEKSPTIILKDQREAEE